MSEKPIKIHEKAFTIRKQKVSGKPQEGFENITWYDFLFDAELETEEEIKQCALALVRGEWLFYNGSSYFLPTFSDQTINTAK